VSPVPRPGRGLWKRLVIGGLLIVAACAAATSVAAFHEVQRVVNAFNQNKSINLGPQILAKTDPGKPQTIMLLGTDARSKTARDYSGTARSDTIILVRLDPSKNATAMLSLPRDLKVQIPGHGVSKINDAYALGGIKLTVETVKQLTGLRINHVISVDFRGFATAVDALGCVWVDIDRRYYNQNQAYATIDVQPGYQKLCGSPALDYVRFRHLDNDIVRAARQQQFLSAIKQQVGFGELIGQRAKLLKIFGKYTRSDIRGRTQVLRILKLAIASAGHPVQEVHFEGNIGPSYVTASANTVQKLASQFLGVQTVKQATHKAKKTRKRRHRRKDPASLGLVDVSGNTRQMALNAIGAGLKMRVLYPKLATRSSQAVNPARTYSFRAPDGRVYRAYRMVFGGLGLGQYWGVQGMTWKNPPLLQGDHDTRTIGGRKFQIYYEGDKIDMVAWITRDGLYYVKNTLSGSLDNDQMLAIARSCRSL